MIAVVRRRLGLRAVGHAGTLDPFATGLLVVLTGKATRLARFVEAARKRYRTTVRFGVATDTEDATGRVIAERTPDAWPERDVLDAAARRFVGGYRQRPPAYSAKHVDGERSYAMARDGRAVELAAVEVAIERFALLEWAPPVATFDAVVGKGTYLRALARDLGEALELPAHCAALRRTAIGGFDVAQAIAPDAVGPEHLLPAAALVEGMPVERLEAEEVRDVGFGRRVARRGAGAAHAALVAPDGRLVAIAEPAGDAWQPVVVLEATP